MYLLVDDIRDLGADVIVRTSAAAKHLLPLSCWTVLALDHDLGDTQENGYELLKWAAEHGHVPPTVQLVTSNPVGRRNMANILKIDLGYTTIDGCTFYKP